MKELEFIEIIKNTLSKNSYIGDDCAYLKDLGIVITQDNLVEDIHFSLKFTTPYKLAYKAIIVNLSDIFASGATPEYITIALSLSKNINSEFIKEFYKACDDLSKEFDFEVIGGDITGGEKCCISICAVGLSKERKISSRKHAQIGDYVIVSGNHGSSAAGLWALQNNISQFPKLVENHLMPQISKDFSLGISSKLKRNYAMMDTSDGLMDALFKIASASDVLISVDFNKIPYDKEIKKVAKMADINFIDWIFYGGEDYQLLACIDDTNLKKINTPYTIIGKVKKKLSSHSVEVIFNNKTEKIKDLEKTFNHFKEQK